METIEEFLSSHNIPYEKNITVEHNNVLYFYPIITPFCIFNCKGGEYKAYKHFKIDLLVDQINRQLELIPDEFKIYILVTQGSDLALLRELFSDKRINIITQLDESIINYDMMPKYYCENAGVIRSLVSKLNTDYDKLNSMLKGIIFDKSQFDHAITILHDDEMEKLKNYEYTISSIIPERYILVTTSGALKDDKYDDIFNVFFFKTKCYSLEDNNNKRLVCRLVQGISEKCTKCHNIFMIKYLHDGICTKCKKVDLLTM